MQFVDLKSQYERIQEDVLFRTSRVFESQQFVMGPEVEELEQQLARYVGVRHVLTCSSGTDALLIPLMAYSLQQTDAVFVPSFTFFASAESVTLAGATPVFVDSDPITFNLAPSALEEAVRATLTQGELTPRGIIAVDLFGQPANYAKIERIAQQYGLFLIEDAAQSFGAEYRGTRTCGFGNVAATSFFPAKPLGCYGDGGALFTNDDNLAKTCASIRIHGQGDTKYDNVRIGINGRLDTLQAAVLLAKLEIFDSEIEARNTIAALYTERLQGLLTTPAISPDATSAWAQYTLIAKDSAQRERILLAMSQSGIPSAVYYPCPIHLSTAYASLGYAKGDLPVCEWLSERVFSLPMHPYLSENDIDRITRVIRETI